MIRRLVAVLLTLGTLVSAGCTTTGDDRDGEASRSTPVAAPFADCTDLTRPPAAGTPSTGPAGAATSAGFPAGAATSVPAGASGGTPLPDVLLTCFTGGRDVAVDAIRGPAVINLWASWCAPCRRELPAFQRLAERTTGQLHVVGVVTRDDRDSAASLGADMGLTYPNIYDPQTRLQRAVSPSVLPVTLLVDVQGRIVHRDTSGVLDDDRLAGLVRQHLGLAVGG